jgi:hypothetical protein
VASAALFGPTAEAVVSRFHELTSDAGLLAYSELNDVWGQTARERSGKHEFLLTKNKAAPLAA